MQQSEDELTNFLKSVAWIVFGCVIKKTNHATGFSQYACRSACVQECRKICFGEANLKVSPIQVRSAECRV